MSLYDDMVNARKSLVDFWSDVLNAAVTKLWGPPCPDCGERLRVRMCSNPQQAHDAVEHAEKPPPSADLTVDRGVTAADFSAWEIEVLDR